jgi:hypothetical protein
LLMCQHMKRVLILINMFGTSALYLITYSQRKTLRQGTAISVTYADENFGCSSYGLVCYYVRSDISEKSAASIFSVTGFGSGGC